MTGRVTSGWRSPWPGLRWPRHPDHSVYPHILAGVYHNSGSSIRQAVAALQERLAGASIPLRLVTGADVHMRPDLVLGLRSGQLLSLADSRYVLVEPPHHTAPPHFESFFFNLVTAGYVPILTHPERLSWVPSHYDAIGRLVRAGVWMQITAGSFAGAFGGNALYWGGCSMRGASISSQLMRTIRHAGRRIWPGASRSLPNAPASRKRSAWF